MASGRELRALQATLIGHGGGDDARRARGLGVFGPYAKGVGVANGRELRALAGCTDRVWAVAVTPDGQYALSASEGNTLKMWQLASGRELRTLIGHPDAVYAVGVSGTGGGRCPASYDHTLKVWDVDSGHTLRTLVSHSGSVRGGGV